jgi:hypothetical protein
VGRDSGGYRSDLGRRGTEKFFAMGLDSRDHTKSGPSGSGFFYTTSFVIATENKNLTRRANHRHDRMRQVLK